MPDSPAPALADAALHPLRHPALDLPGLAHGFFTREGGVSSGLYASLNAGLGSKDDQEAVRENRTRMAAALGVRPDRLATPYQVHSADVVVTTEAFTPQTRPRADALVTATPGLAVGVSTADCGPVLFADPEARVVGAAHAGWKGATTGVLEATLRAMEGLGARRARTVAVLGPTISRQAYEVGPEFVARLVAQDEANLAFLGPSDRPEHARFDLPAYIAHRLRAADIGRFDDMGLCTYADEARFYSYRRTTHRGEPDYGRLLHAIALV